MTNPFRLGLLAASVAMIGLGVRVQWLVVSEDPYRNYYSRDAVLMFRGMSADVARMPLLTAGLLGVLLWLALSAVREPPGRPRPVAALLGLGLLTVVTGGGAMALLWAVSMMHSGVYRFFAAQNGAADLDQSLLQYWRAVSANAVTLQQLCGPLLIVAALGLFAVLAILARTGGRQPEATAAS